MATTVAIDDLPAGEGGGGPEKWDEVLAGITRAQQDEGLPATPPLTVIGVQALFAPELVVEIEATAVLN
ncbi:hypothetical protein [Micromonospora sp. C95]|uniref:hypothetical protein n=1 Tax=Micromonospora sp. C95 TaxID=2824882 RepID=UPI001B37B7AF|nr:hypothetical protein [Micromonospora sp. C95]MBQ1023920.1 hypothetical protein [Micromonospora sp. C95]